MRKRTLDQIAKKLGWMAVWGGTEKLDVHDMNILCSQLADQLRAHIPATTAPTGEQACANCNGAGWTSSDPDDADRCDDCNTSTGEQAGEVVGEFAPSQMNSVASRLERDVAWAVSMIRSAAQPRPVGVPDALSYSARATGKGHNHDYIAGWNACRDATLATAPAPGKGDEA